MMTLSNDEDFKQAKKDQSDVLKANNPSNRDYIIGVKMRDYFFKSYPNKKQKNAFFADVCICMVSKFPFFEFHRKILMLICSK